MKKINFLLCLFFACAALAAENSGNLTQISPQEKAAATWDFGRAKEGEVLKHKFTLKNQSANVLNIKSVQTSCGCTVSKAQKQLLQPGESTALEVQFNTKGFIGKTTKHIYVNTDSLDNPIITYIIKAEVVK